MRKTALIVAFTVIFAASAGGCGASAASANVKFAASQTDLSVREMSVRVAPLAGYEEFTSYFAITTRDRLRAQGVRVEDDAAGSSERSNESFRYHLNCYATPQERTMTVTTPTATITGFRGAVLNVAVRCTLRDEETQFDLLEADVDAVKGWGPGFGREEAQPAAERLVEEMALRGVF